MAAEGPVMVNGEPNPTGTGRYCPPAICWCGKCAWWKPIPPIDWSRQPGTTAHRNRLAELDPS